MTFNRKIAKQVRTLRALISSVYLNFYYLPFSQARKFPILMYKPKFRNIKGKIIIDADKVTFGMIRLGFPTVSIYPNTGVIYDNNGGTIIIKGACRIGNNSAISIGSVGKLIIGKDFGASSSLKIVCYHSIEFKERVRIGWENFFMDTDFHRLKKADGSFTKGYGTIVIGNNNWFGFKCTVLKNTETPDFCTVGGNSLLNSRYEYPPYVLIAGNPCVKRADGLYRDYDEDSITYANL